MRILIVTQWFYPEPSFKGLPFARALAARGHQVTVLTGFPNYPGGKIYPGYRVRPWQREIVHGISVVRVALYPSHDRSAWRRVANYASFALAASILGVVVCGRCDVAYVYHPPASVGLTVFALRLRGIPCVYDINDLWPDTLAATGMIRNRWLLAAAGWWCRAVYAAASRVVVVSPGFKRKLQERGVPAYKVNLIYNWSPDAGVTELVSPLAPTEAKQLAGKFNVLFAGNMGPAQALNTVLEAARRVWAEASGIQFVFVGGGIEVDALRAKSAGIPNVRFLTRRSAAEMPALYAAVDVLLVHLKDDPLFAITIPSKTQTYLAAGKPIIAGLHGDGAEMIRDSGAGLICPPEDVPALAAAVLQMAAFSPEERADMGRKGRIYYDRDLAMEIGVGAYERQLREAARTSASPSDDRHGERPPGGS